MSSFKKLCSLGISKCQLIMVLRGWERKRKTHTYFIKTWNRSHVYLCLSENLDFEFCKYTMQGKTTNNQTSNRTDKRKSKQNKTTKHTTHTCIHTHTKNSKKTQSKTHHNRMKQQTGPKLNFNILLETLYSPKSKMGLLFISAEVSHQSSKHETRTVACFHGWLY